MTAGRSRRLTAGPEYDWDSDKPCPVCLKHTPELEPGVVDIKQEPCFCAATHAPCSNCESSWWECRECGARSDDFYYEETLKAVRAI